MIRSIFTVLFCCSVVTLGCVDPNSENVGGATSTGGSNAEGGSNSEGGTKSDGGRTSATGGAPDDTSGGNGGTMGSLSLGGTATTGGTTGSSTTETIGGSGGTGGTTSSGGTPSTEPKSCQGAETLSCQGESCCTTIRMTGGTFPMGRGMGSDAYSGDSDEVPEHSATISEFSLDKYEVTVGRFRQFVEAYTEWRQAGNPVTDAGANPNVTAQTGWGRSWTPSTSDLPADSTALATALKCGLSYQQTWTDTAESNESYPINCVNWYEAFAFCIWDGGRLPTEAEWEYAAAGGEQNRLYPWGSLGPTQFRANFYGTAENFSTIDGRKPSISVGNSGLEGAGYYGHQDLAGSMYEWVFDWYLSDYYGTTESPQPCNNCANAVYGLNRVIRGGCWSCIAKSLRGAFRGAIEPINRYSGVVGFRCSRTP
jgi:formylglycine-generating enzyme